MSNLYRTGDPTTVKERNARHPWVNQYGTEVKATAVFLEDVY